MPAKRNQQQPVKRREVMHQPGDIPDAIKDRLCDLQNELRGRLPKTAIRWTMCEQVHLTLRFFGNVRTEDLEHVQSTLQNACKDTVSFRLEVSGLGIFPEKRFPRII